MDPVTFFSVAMVSMGVGMTVIARIASYRFDRKYGFDSKTGLPLPRKQDQ